MEKGRFGQGAIDLIVDYADLLIVPGFLAIFWAINCKIQAGNTRLKNNIVRSRDTKDIAPLNPDILKEANYIAESVF